MKIVSRKQKLIGYYSKLLNALKKQKPDNPRIDFLKKQINRIPFKREEIATVKPKMINYDELPGESSSSDRLID